jgi:hypothetical protein
MSSAKPDAVYERQISELQDRIRDLDFTKEQKSQVRLIMSRTSHLSEKVADSYFLFFFYVICSWSRIY